MACGEEGGGWLEEGGEGEVEVVEEGFKVSGRKESVFVAKGVDGDEGGAGG